MKNDFYDFPAKIQPHENNVGVTRLSDGGQLLFEVLTHAQNNTQARTDALKGKTYHVSSLGGSLTNTYEKIRNSAEYTENHLMLQKAIRRYLHRNLFIDIRLKEPQLVEELITELTQGGYIQNDSITEAHLYEIRHLIDKFYDVFQGIVQSGIPTQKAQLWLLETLSVECEWILKDPSYLFAYAHFVHKHVLKELGVLEKLEDIPDKNDDTNFVYYLVILKNLLKADRATMRAVLTAVYKVPHKVPSMIQFNERFDTLLLSDTMKQALKIINRRGAPLRILRSAFFDETKNDQSIIYKPASFLSLINNTTRSNYDVARKKLNSGVIKSLSFLVITKVLIGMAIEIPVDMWLYGKILLLPLTINLLAPPLFMIFQRLTLKIPGERNIEAIREYVQDLVYINEDRQTQKSLWASPRAKRSSSRIFGVIYIISSLLIFSLTALCLSTWHFNIVQYVIFFIFLSTATFLGFRLSLVIKDLELIGGNQNILGSIRDFIYMPFIFLGQWMSGKYSQFNIISILLDLIIELPLKTTLRLIRQWVRFLDEKKETLN